MIGIFSSCCTCNLYLYEYHVVRLYISFSTCRYTIKGGCLVCCLVCCGGVVDERVSLCLFCII